MGVMSSILKGLCKRFVWDSAQPGDLTDQVSMGNDHSAAAVSLESEVVENIFRVLSHSYALDVLRVGGANDLSASETSHRDNHAITLTV